MKVKNVIKTIQAQIVFGRTLWGRRLNELAISALESCVSDVKNYETTAVQCLNCGIIVSDLLIPDGCIYCHCPDMSKEIRQENIRQ